MKLNKINELLEILSNSTFKNAPYKLKFEKIGRKYCIVIFKRNKYLNVAEFNTYDDVLAHLKFMMYVFDRRNYKCGK